MTHSAFEKESIVLLQPRDIVISSATILGLVVTAFALMISLSEGKNVQVVRSFALVFVGVVLLFVISVAMATLSTLTGRYSLWRASVVAYILGWLFLGTVLLSILLGYILGIESFQPQLPQFDASLVSLAAASLSVFSTSVTIAYFTVYLRRRLETFVQELHSKMSAAEIRSAADVRAQLLSGDADLTTALSKLRIQIESNLRRIGREAGLDGDFIPVPHLLDQLHAAGLMDKELVESVRYVYNQCSAGIHGVPIRVENAQRIMDLGATVLVALTKIAVKK
jgi:hypothetical protein